MTGQERAEIQEQFDKLATKNGGTLTPEAVVEAARDEESPLHKHFDWDAERGFYRSLIDRARDLIRSVHVTVLDSEKKTVLCPVWVRDPDADSEIQGYVAVPTLAADPNRARRALVAECRQAAAILQRVRNLARAFRLERDVADILARLEVVIEKAERRRGTRKKIVLTKGKGKKR